MSANFDNVFLKNTNLHTIDLPVHSAGCTHAYTTVACKHTASRRDSRETVFGEKWPGSAARWLLAFLPYKFNRTFQKDP